MDGYNIIKQAPAFADQPLEDGRAGLLRWIETQRPQGSANNRVTVVFDGKPEHFGAGGFRVESGAARVVFSRNESADDHIKTMVEKSGERPCMVVVSDDKGIVLYVRSLGARTMAVKTFASGLFVPTGRPSSKQGRPTGAKAGKYISLTKAQQINREMERIWLKK